MLLPPNVVLRILSRRLTAQRPRRLLWISPLGDVTGATAIEEALSGMDSDIPDSDILDTGTGPEMGTEMSRFSLFSLGEVNGGGAPISLRAREEILAMEEFEMR